MKAEERQRKEMNIENKKAYHDYFVNEKIECGISLKGNEVKSIRDGKANIKDAWCTIQNGNLVLRGMHISAWKTSNLYDIDENRERQLLVHKKEIVKLAQIVQKEGVTLIPLKVYFTEKGKCKILIGICRGKHNYDKRETLKDKQVKRDINRALKERNKL